MLKTVSFYHEMVEVSLVNDMSSLLLGKGFQEGVLSLYVILYVYVVRNTMDMISQ